MRLRRDDAEFIRIEYHVAKAKDAGEALRCLIAANHANLNTKLGKAYLVEQGVLCFGADLVVKDVQTLPQMLERGIAGSCVANRLFLGEPCGRQLFLRL